jgi:hypothetical protein
MADAPSRLQRKAILEDIIFEILSHLDRDEVFRLRVVSRIFLHAAEARYNAEIIIPCVVTHELRERIRRLRSVELDSPG